MADVAVVTAVFGGYDTLKPPVPQVGVDVEWVCVTDGAPLTGPAATGWRLVVEPQPGVHPNRAAKRPKMLPWEYTDAAASVWIDASYRVISDRFVVEALEHADPIGQFAHYWRDCLYDEAAASAVIPQYGGEPIAAQADHYRQAGHPEHWGLWAAGVIARWHTAAVRALGTGWLAEVEAWSFQDQVSEPFVLRSLGLRPSQFPGDHLTNGWLVHEGHEGSDRH